MLTHYYYVDGMSFCSISKWNWSDEYSVSGRIQKCGEGAKGAWALSSRSRGSREEGHLEPGLERRSRSGGPELGRWSRSRGPREEGCNREYEHEEEEGLRRTRHKVIRVMYMQR